MKISLRLRLIFNVLQGFREFLKINRKVSIYFDSSYIPEYLHILEKNYQ